MTEQVRVVWPLGALLGEGPVWITAEQSLRFVDIKGGRLHRYDPATERRETLEVGGAPSFIVPEAGGGLLVGSGDGIYRLDGAQLGRRVVSIDQPGHNRTNDGTVDAFGRLWFGTMDNHEQRPTGTLWCLDHGRLHHMGGQTIVTNGPAISADGATLYHVDSVARAIWRCPAAPGPWLGGGEIFLRLAEADGYPDGIALDTENCLWVALWDGWGVRRYAPDGTLLMKVALPCARVTKLAFGGPGLRTAYVTTATIGLSNADRVDQPAAGAVFAFDAPAAGVGIPAARLDV